jgi:molybdopterin-containing oxidoreductase family membrane subunit
VTTWLVQRISGKTVVKPEVFRLLGKISGIMLIIYILLKAIDTYVWMNFTSPAVGFSAFSFYNAGSFGSWILFAEIVVFGLVPAILLLNGNLRKRPAVLVTAAFMVCTGIMLNRFVMTIQTLALPTLPFDAVLSYMPSWQEVATFLAVVAYGMLLYSISFRYMTLFPQEKDISQSSWR